MVNPGKATVVDKLFFLPIANLMHWYLIIFKSFSSCSPTFWIFSHKSMIKNFLCLKTLYDLKILYFLWTMSISVILLSSYFHWKMSGSVITRFIRRLQHGQLMWPQWHWKTLFWIFFRCHARSETDIDHLNITWASNSDAAFDSPAKLSYLDSLQDSGEECFLQQKNL